MSEDEVFVVSILCSSCAGQIRLGDDHCPSCKREVTKDEARDLKARWMASDPAAAQQADVVGYGRYTLIIVAGLSVMEGLVYGVIGESTAVLVFSALIAALMVGLFFWSEGRPLMAMVLGLSVYVGLQVLAATVSVWSLLTGLLIKVLIVIALTGGIAAELTLRRRDKAFKANRAG